MSALRLMAACQAELEREAEDQSAGALISGQLGLEGEDAHLVLELVMDQMVQRTIQVPGPKTLIEVWAFGVTMGVAAERLRHADALQVVVPDDADGA